MSNPFEDPEATYRVLRNHENQHSLWPDAIAVPDGWETVHGPADRQACMDYIDREWADLRPASLIRVSEE